MSISQEVVLSIEGLQKSFGTKVVHRDVSIDLRKGEILALFGGSGTGKSVVLRSIIGLDRPDGGKIIFENNDITKFNEEELIDVRKKIGYVFQNGALFDSMTVEENLAYPLREHTKLTNTEIHTRIEQMLELIGLSGSEQLLPANLSGGMQKRVGVARAIILKPQIILYDEPTAGLDPYNTHRLIGLMQRIQEQEDVASIFVTHDLPSAFSVANRIAILHEGKIRTLDTVENVKKSNDPFVQSFLAGEEF